MGVSQWKGILTMEGGNFQVTQLATAELNDDKISITGAQHSNFW